MTPLKSRNGFVAVMLILLWASTDDLHAQPAPSHSVIGLVSGGRSHGGFYTEQRIRNLRNNCEMHDWARNLQHKAVEKAADWVGIPDDSLWSMVPGQDLPRCIDVTFDRLTQGPKSLGCLKCGNEIRRFGNYPYDPDFKHLPWKLTCPSCGSVFPTNDFAKYYASAIDDRGLFNPSLGDTALLYNTDHPDPSDPLHKFGVDDGYGFIDENGRGHRFIGYYTWKYWMHLNEGLSALADAYLFTGEKLYAHKAAILLDRIADVYPDMDWKPYADRGWYHSDGGSHVGKIEGRIWETSVVQKFADSYDKIISGTIDAPELFAFLSRQASRFTLPTPKGTREQFLKNVDQRILHTAFDAVKSGQILGNQGMHQLTVAMCAIALNTEPHSREWLDWLFEPQGGAIPGLMINQFDRDGTSDEGAPSYAMIWGRLISQLAARLSAYSEYDRNNIFEDYPQFRATFLAPYRMAALGIAIPNIGDSGATGLVSSGLVDPEFMAMGYRYTQDPEIAIAAYRANGNSATGLSRDIFSEDPDAVSREIESIGRTAGPRPAGGHLMSGFGLALLESGTGSQGVALAVNYGRTIKHAHPDMLNFDLFAFDHWLTPDHGYPEFATRWPSNAEWTGTTLSHNTVLVDKKPQHEVWGGHARRFKQLNDFGVVQIDGRKAYPHLKQYVRTLYLIGDAARTANEHPYVVDVFRIEGGNDHLYSFHGPPGQITHNLIFNTQEGGTLAGPDIDKGTWATGFPIGYSHLYNVRRNDSPPSTFVLDWKAQEGYRGLSGDVHVRLHVLTESDEVILADGDPPQNKPGNPERLGYALIGRSGYDLNTTFVTVVEPYRDRPSIRSITRLQTTCDHCVVLRIEHTDDRVDLFVHNDKPGRNIDAKQLRTDGASAWIRSKENRAERAVLVDGTKLKHRSLNLKSTGALEGKVLKMNRELKGGGWLIVDQALPDDGSLIGAQITIDSSDDRDASYTIRKIESDGNNTRIYCGPISFVRAFKGEQVVIRHAKIPRDYNQGYLYDFEEGAAFRISHHAEWKAGQQKRSTRKQTTAILKP